MPVLPELAAPGVLSELQEAYASHRHHLAADGEVPYTFEIIR